MSSTAEIIVVTIGLPEIIIAPVIIVETTTVTSQRVSLADWQRGLFSVAWLVNRLMPLHRGIITLNGVSVNIVRMMSVQTPISHSMGHVSTVVLLIGDQ